MAGDALPQHLDHFLEGRVDVHVVAADAVHVLPPAQPDRPEHPVHVLEGQLHLAGDVVGVESAGVVPAALPGAFDDVAQHDGLRVVAEIAVLLACAFFVVVLEGRHGV